MALSGKAVTDMYDDRYYMLSWTASQNVPAHKSTIYWELSCRGGRSSWYSEQTLQVIIAGKTVVNKTDRVRRYIGIIASGSFEVTHDGVGAYRFSASIKAAVDGSSINCTGSKDFVIDAMPDTATLTVADGVLGTAQTLRINSASSSYTYTITYSSGSYEDTICSKTSSTSISWAPPLEIANNVVDGGYVYINVYFKAFNGSATIVDTSYTIICDIPSNSSTNPSMSFTIEDSEGYAPTFGGYVKNRSKPKIKVNASFKYGASLLKCEVTVDGKVYSGLEVIANSFTTTGSKPISVKVIDTRGNFTTSTATIYAIEFDPPKLSDFKIYRSNSSGTVDDKGSYICITFSSEISPLGNKNSAVYQIRYKDSTYTGGYTTVDLDNYDNVYSITNGKHILSVSPTISIDVILIARDRFSEVQLKGVGPAVSKVISIRHGGLGIALGKIAVVSNCFDVAWRAIFRQDITVYGDILDKFGKPISNGVAKYTGSGGNAQSETQANYTTHELILTDAMGAPGHDGGLYYVMTMFHENKTETSNRAQIAVPYDSIFNKSIYYRIYHKNNYNGWTNWNKLITSSDRHFTNGHFINSVSIGDKTSDFDGKEGVYLNKNGYIHLQRDSYFGDPYIGFLCDESTTINGMICYNKLENRMEYLNAQHHYFSHEIKVEGAITAHATELYHATPYIDFHYNNSASDYTHRIIALGTGNLTAYPGISNGSDRRIKKDIKDIDEKYIDVLKSLKTVEYRYIKYADNLRIGFIAQDFEKALLDNGIDDIPVIDKTQDGEYTLDYSQIGPLCVYGWQYHDKIVEEQQKEIDDLKKQVQELKELVLNLSKKG